MNARHLLKTTLTLLLIHINILLFSQTFTNSGVVLNGIANGSSLFGDADNDNDIDILIAGYDASNALDVRLYLNDGSNNFSDAGNIFSPSIPSTYGSYTMSAQWVDIDNDGYLDIVLNCTSGYSEGNTLLIYQHQAGNTYLLKTTIAYWTWQGNSFDCGDYDNDGDQDILLVTNGGTRIYQNQGNFVFIERTSIVMDGLSESSCEFGDYDNDGDLDILLTGFINASYSGTYRIYKNNGNNSFTLQSEISISGRFDGAADWGDYNNDGFLDILVAGKYGATSIFKNNGDNTFTQQNVGTLPLVYESAAKWGDLDNDGDLDFVISGKNVNTNITKAYINNGDNTFTELEGFTVDGLYKSSVDLYDYDKDGDLDILISGYNGSTKVSKLFINGSSVANPTPAAPTGLSVTTSGNDVVLSWDPVTTDNTPSASISYNIMVGTSSGGINIVSPNSNTSTGLHRISGMGNGQHGTSFVLRNLKRGVNYYWKVQAVDNSWKGSAFSSYTGGTGYFIYTAMIQASGLNVPEKDGSTATLSWVRGNGSNCAVFLKEANSGTASPSNGSVYTGNPAFNSGTQIGITGWYCVYNGPLSSVNVTNLKPNTDYIFHAIEYTGTTYDISTSSENPLTFKTGTFTEIKSANLLPVSSSTNIPVYCYWVDIDNDAGNDLDLVLQGSTTDTKIYRNDGSNVFTLLSTTITSGYASAIGDYNRDGLIDIALASDPAKLYQNNGSGVFSEIPGAFPVTNFYGSMDWGDYDNDGDPDILIIGNANTEGNKSAIYRNDGGGAFTELTSTVLPGLAYGSAKWIDFNNDGMLDFIISGGTNSASSATKIYKNTGNGNFAELAGTPFLGSSRASIDWGDYDGDGDLDLLTIISGSTKIYRNNGDDTFTLQSTPSLPSVSYGSVSWGDYDNDGDLDILLTGYTGTYKFQITKIFRNEGANTFTEDQAAVLPGVGSGTASWGDYDKDGDLDIILSGMGVSESISRIYRNDNTAFNTAPAAPLSPVATVNKSDVTLTWESVKTDNTPAKSMTYNLRVGTSSGGINIVSPGSASNGLRRVVEKGNAQLDTTFLLKKMAFGTYYWSVQAVDNSYAGSPFSSQGQFTVSPVQAGSLSATIIDKTSLLLKWDRGNGDRCVVFARQTSTGTATPINNTGYVADPEFGFGSQIGSSGWYCIYNGRGDSVVVTGLVASKQYSFHIIEYMGTFGSENYFTVTADGNPGVFSTSLFTEQAGIILTSGRTNNVVWGDYDNDGFTDLLIPGYPNTRIYRNNGNNTFTEKTGISLVSVTYGCAEWGDYDRDGDLDIAITGSADLSYPPVSGVTKIYKNNGADVFTEQTSIVLPQLLYSALAWGDYDNDGDLDLALSGATGTSPNYVPVSKIYTNNNGTFSEETQISLTPMFKGSIRWVDYDNDGDLDLVMTGAVENTQYNDGVTKIYKNNGDKTFTEQTGLGLDGASFSATAWGDFDNDGDLDVMITRHGYMNIYQNNRNNSFVHHLGVYLPFQGACYAAWGDYDSDGYLDIILTNPGLDTKIYRNTHGIPVPGAVTQWFNKQDDEAVQNIGYSFVNWIDYDNDGDLDFLIAKDEGLPTKIFQNNLVMKSGLFKSNTPPAEPAGLKAVNTPSGVVLSWNPVENDETPSESMSYNVRIGTSESLYNTCPPQSASSGYREIAAIGNAQVDTTFLLLNMPAIRYYWSVQAVDMGLKGGAWSSPSIVDVKNVLSYFTADTVCFGLTTHFTNQSVAFGESVLGYKWIFEDGSVSTLTDPTYTFNSAGEKNVTLITYSSSTSDTTTRQVLVKAKPLIDFSSSLVCQGSETVFTNLSDIAGLNITSWSWDYGDGKGSTAMNPGTHGYLLPGDYEVILSASADNSCSGSLTRTVQVAAYPSASVSATTPLSFCSGDSVVLTVAVYTNHTYRWLSNDVEITGESTNSLTAKISGNYKAEVINLAGNCKTTSSPAVVTVLNAPAAPSITYNGLLTFCQNDSVRLSVSGASDYSYQWKLNGGAVGSNSNIYYAKSTGTYNVIMANSSGCSTASTNQIALTVNALPVVGDISRVGNELRFCSGESITLNIPANASYSYNWKKGTADIGKYTNSISATESGDYSVEVSTTQGCKVLSSPVSIEVVNRPLQPFIDPGLYKPQDCLGESPLKLSVKEVAEGYSYRWFRNGIQISRSTSIETRDEGKYYLEAVYDICVSKRDSLEIDLENTLPEPQIIAKGPSIWYLSTNSQAGIYRWYFNGIAITGATGNVYVAGQNLGLYRLAISNDGNCFAFSDTIRIPTGITGIEDTDPFAEVKIYPNPTTGMFTIEMNNNVFGELTIDILTQNGSKSLNIKFEKTTENFSSQIDLSGQSKGMYLVNLSLDKFRAVRKVVVE